VQLQAGLELSTRTAKASHELFWRAVVGMSFFQDRGFGRAWSPMVELLGARELEEDATTHWDIVPQLQVTLPTRQHVRVALGVRLPLDHFADRPTQLMCYLLWDWFDGSLLEGW